MSTRTEAGAAASRPTRVSTPAKVILMGEHAAVYGRPALVAALGLRLQCSLQAGDDAGVAIDLPELGHRGAAGWPEILELTDRMRELWEAYAADPTPARYRELSSDDPALVVKLALGEAARSLADRPDEDPDSPMARLSLRIDSRIPIGSGFGSSAATAVAVVTAYLARSQGRPDWDRVARLALEVERRQHGFPSGIDSGTVFHGGVLWARKTGEDGLEQEPLAARPGLLRNLCIHDTGRPAETTGTVVAEVRSRRDRDPVAFEELLGRMEDATERLRRMLERDDVLDTAPLAPIREFQACLEELGVVPAGVRRRIRDIEDRGGAAKISGAGALSGDGAGLLLVYHPDPAFHDDGPLPDLTRHDAPLGVEGARLETAP